MDPGLLLMQVFLHPYPTFLKKKKKNCRQPNRKRICSHATLHPLIFSGFSFFHLAIRKCKVSRRRGTEMPRGRLGKMLFFLAEKTSTGPVDLINLSSPLFPYRDINLILDFLMLHSQNYITNRLLI
jgi:hypothetical protein